MAKVLLGRHNIEAFMDRDSNSLMDDGNLIIPPGIKDFLHTEGIAVHRYKQELSPKNILDRDTSKMKEPACREKFLSQLVARTVAVLKSDYGIKEEETMQRLCMLVMEQLKN